LREKEKDIKRKEQNIAHQVDLERKRLKDREIDLERKEITLREKEKYVQDQHSKVTSMWSELSAKELDR
jgi:hypothetical protein